MARSAFAGLVALGLFQAPRLVLGEYGFCARGSNDPSCSLALLQLPHRAPVLSRSSEAESAPQSQARRTSYDLAGKSIYFLMIDRFARSNGDESGCSGKQWCNGTLRGITENLDYIKGMGFDCIWITPVVKQFQGQDMTTPNNDTAFHGYWAYDWYDVDPHFGSKQDLRDLSDALHARGMCFILDMVVNHVGPILSGADVAKVHPFNKTEYYNQAGIQPGMTFDDFTRCYRENHSVDPTSCPWPTQALQTAALGTNPPKYLPYCGIGDYCAGYDNDLVRDGWFYDLGDLNQSVPFVRETLITWASDMVKMYALDAIRLDTASFVPTDFLAALQSRVGVQILGEVTTTNQTFHASYQVQRDPGPSSAQAGKPVLDGLLNFPLGLVAPYAFCGHVGSSTQTSYPASYPFASLNLTRLGDAMAYQLQGGLYQDTELLGNFIDNHDVDYRVGHMCHKHPSRLLNSLAWVMFARGIPIIYYGTEQGMENRDDVRTSLWQFGFDTSTSLYNFFALANRVRKEFKLTNAESTVVYADEEHLVFTRGGPYGAWVYLNNLLRTQEDVVYPRAVPPVPPPGKTWVNVLETGAQPVQVDGSPDLVVRGSLPQVLVLVDSKHLES